MTRIAAMKRVLVMTPTLLRVAFSEAIAYRAELLIWTLSITMPFIMMALWHTVALSGAVGRFGPNEFIVYFLATTIVRQLASSWVCWELNFAVRQGTLSSALLRPVSVLWWFATQNIAALAFRCIATVPFAVLMLMAAKSESLSGDPLVWALWLVSLVGAWLITFLSNVAIGSLSLYMESSLKVMDLWLALYFVLSGYLVPVELFPEWLRHFTNVLPFRFQLGLPVELMTGRYGHHDAMVMLTQQWAYVAALFVLAVACWRYGLRRYAAYGG